MEKISKIKSLKAREILDSKGTPTIEVELETGEGLFLASVPSGVSKGENEALELRDGGKRYKGIGVLKAVKNVNEIIASKIKGKDVREQKKIDNALCRLDKTKNKSKLGANSILGVSMAVCRAGARAQGKSLYGYISQIFNKKKKISKKILKELTPSMLMIEGGLHAGNKLDIQEFMIAPSGKDFEEKLRRGTEIYKNLEVILEKKYGAFSTNLGFEGGFAAPLFYSKIALDLIMEAIEETDLLGKVKIVLDVAASYFFEDQFYKFEEGTFTSEGILNFYSDLIKKYPILGIEDPFSEKDWKAFSKITKKFGGKIFIIGDDLLTTNVERIKKAVKKKCCNSLVLKPNQVGTVTETLEAAKLAAKSGLEVFVKHRGGETNDDFISDLAVGIGAKYIMAGAPQRGERVAKYNRLLKIEQELS